MKKKLQSFKTGRRIDKDERQMKKRSHISKGLCVKFLKVRGYFTLKKKKRRADLYYCQNIRCQIEPFSRPNITIFFIENGGKKNSTEYSKITKNVNKP